MNNTIIVGGTISSWETGPFHHPYRDHFIMGNGTISSPRDHFITPLWKHLHRLTHSFSTRLDIILNEDYAMGRDEGHGKTTSLSTRRKLVSSLSSDSHAFITKYLVQVTLPHRQPPGNPEAWQRRNGKFSLTIRPGLIPTEEGFKKLRYPSGSIPRLLLLWMTKEVLRKQERRIHLGQSLPDFMQAIGLNPNNGSLKSLRSDRRRLQEQMNNLFRSQILFGYTDLERHAWKDLSVTTEGEIWWDFYSDGLFLFDSWIELGEHFYDSLLEAPVPLSMDALRQLKNSSLSLDLYAWSAYAAFTASKRGEPFRVTWKKLHESLGADYARTCDFKKRAKHAFLKVLKVYPDLRIEDDGDLLLVRSSMTPVRPLIRQV